MTITENTAITTAAEDPCPPWCTVKHGDHDIHSGDITEISLSLAEPFEAASGGMLPDYLGVRLWHEKAEMPRPAVGLQHGDDYLPDMTPAEAVALAAALVRAAWRAQPAAAPAGDPDGCPPWCEITDHQDTDGGKMHHALVESLPLSGYPYDVQGTRCHQSLLAIRKQVRNGEPAILIEAPDEDADDPDGNLEMPEGQVMLSTGEAVELAVTLLELVTGPEALLAMRAD